MSDDFYRGMTDHLQFSLDVAIKEVNRLRAANRDLQSQLSAVAPDMWAMQELITQLEWRVMALAPNAEKP